ncbi:hypothetical protein NEMIN01_2514, partial [Nematocida minor]|uniref:uncharacterized protein n=1 Tax=Nematocida minor TaxID=1912983 RepID=UPI00221FCE5D
LLNENLSEEKVNEYVCTIKSDQVIKLIVIEYIMSGHLIDYKNNTLFCNLRKIIENVFDPVEYKKMDLHTLVCEGVKQDEILRKLAYIWIDYSSNCTFQRTKDLCKDIGIEYSNFEKIQFDIIATNWMYEGVMAPLVNLGVPLDISYTHPAWYALMRSKCINDLDTNDSDNYDLLTEVERNEFLFAPHAIKVTDNELVWAKYMKDCIRAFFSSFVQVIDRRDDNRRYSKLVSNFARYLSVGCPKEETKIKYDPSIFNQKNESS